MLGTDRRFRSGGRESSNCSLSSCTVPSSKHAGTTAKPSFSINSLKPLSLLVSLRVNVGYLGRILCPIGWGSGTWPVTAAGSKGRCNTTYVVDPQMLPRQRTDLTGFARSNLGQKGFSRESAQVNRPQPLRASHELRLGVS